MQKVLIVDDEPDIRELLEITLGRMNLRTQCAADLETAHHLLQQNDFHLCLTDMRLPITFEPSNNISPISSSEKFLISLSLIITSVFPAKHEGGPGGEAT